jgi:hypothetical protein
LPRKTHTSLFAQPAAVVKRAGDINPGKIKPVPKPSDFYAARPLDDDEERATNGAQALTSKNQHKFRGRTDFS